MGTIAFYTEKALCIHLWLLIRFSGIKSSENRTVHPLLYGVLYARQRCTRITLLLLPIHQQYLEFVTDILQLDSFQPTVLFVPHQLL
jgi:hypothetical protein